MKFQAGKTIRKALAAAILWGIAAPGILRAQGESPKDPEIFVKLYADRLIVTSEDEPVASIPISRIRLLALETRTRYPVKTFISEAWEAAGDWDDLYERAGVQASWVGPLLSASIAAEALVALPFRWIHQSRYTVQIAWEDAEGLVRLTAFPLGKGDAKRLLRELSRITDLDWLNLDYRKLKRPPRESVSLRFRQWVWIGDICLGPGTYSAGFYPLGSNGGALVLFAGAPGTWPLATVPVAFTSAASEGGPTASVKPDNLGQLHLTALRVGSADLHLFPSAAVSFTPASQFSRPAYAGAQGDSRTSIEKATVVWTGGKP